jgi:hypothetical protein
VSLSIVRVPYLAVDVSVTTTSGSGVVYVPEAVAVFAFAPAAAAYGPSTQRASWESLASATGRLNGAVRGVPSPSTHEQLEGLGLVSEGSVTSTELRRTSPTFSTVNR